MKLRPAEAYDVDEMCALDPEARRAFVDRAVAEGTATVAVVDERVVGFAILEHSFFERGFLSLLLVDPAHRRRGIGEALVRHAEGRCRSERIFTSTNESNAPMRSLLEKLGYRYSGTVDDLDPGDPERFYSRALR